MTAHGFRNGFRENYSPKEKKNGLKFPDPDYIISGLFESSLYVYG